jgi:LacI family transcriptional regulator
MKGKIMGKTKATLADVAQAAGVSSATASRLIHGTGPVSDGIRVRIESAIAALGYEPRKKTTTEEPDEGTIAVVAGDLLNPYFPEVIRGVQDEADNYGMILTLYNLTDHFQRQNLLIQKLSRQNIGGIILMGTQPFPALVEWQQKQRIPMVLLNRRVSLPLVHCIMVDFENALYRATQHLVNLNHVRIGYLSSYSNSDISVARRRGIEQALKEAGLSLRPEYCISVPSGIEVDGGFQAMNNLLDRPEQERPTAILAFNDVVALGALRAVQMHGVCIPQDLSLIGVDDIFSSVYTNPPLTTIGQPKFRMGAMAVQRLRLMSQDTWLNDNNYTILESPLIVRESTGPAPR